MWRPRAADEPVTPNHQRFRARAYHCAPWCHRMRMLQAAWVLLKAGQSTPAMHLRRNLWLQASEQYPLFAAAAARQLSCNAASCAAERNWSAWDPTYTSLRNRLSKEKAEQLIFVKANMAVEQEAEVVPAQVIVCLIDFLTGIQCSR